MLNYNDVISALVYNSETGDFFWKKDNKNHVKQGSKAGNLSPRGYVVIRILGELHKAHRLAWIYTFKEWPNGEIDHKNHVKHDNRIKNLRVVDRTGQNRNAAVRKDNTSGHAGVCFHKRAKKWQATIGNGKGVTHIGYFSDMQEAIDARNKAANEFGYHKN